MEPRRRESYSVPRVVHDDVPADEVKRFVPTDCFFLDFSDPIRLRMAYVLSSIVYSVYGFVPEVLEDVHRILGAEPLRLADSVEGVSQMMYAKRILRLACISCAEVGCPWGSVIKSLKTSWPG